ncbi:MAG TPA: hypothetical protein VMT00_09350 [Thermoanaerobaculia bacterium]|nr:hypothetical protein [Thermoanaerobaculia bacterium]
MESKATRNPGLHRLAFVAGAAVAGGAAFLAFFLLRATPPPSGDVTATADVRQLPPGHPPLDTLPPGHPAIEGNASVPELPHGHPPIRTEGTAPRVTVAGTIDIVRQATKRMPASGWIFVIIRADGADSAPAVAAKRYPLGSFPLPFEITEEDWMIGEGMPERVRIDARIDHDGDVATREAGAPSATINNVASGSREVKVVLE